MPERPSGDPPGRVGRLYEMHGDALYRYAVMLLADAAAAEDVIQQVFAKLLRQGGGLTAIDDVPYLRRAVRNECYSLLRKRRGDRAPAGPLLEVVAPQVVHPDERLFLERALRLLPPEQREVIHMHVYEGLTLQQTAEALALSINTVASRYRYALAKLRQALSSL